MVFTWSPVSIINAILCATILILAYLNYKESKNIVIFSVAVAFGVFGISHVIALFGPAQALTAFLIGIRMFAYLCIITALVLSRAETKP